MLGPIAEFIQPDQASDVFRRGCELQRDLRIDILERVLACRRRTIAVGEVRLLLGLNNEIEQAHGRGLVCRSLGNDKAGAGDQSFVPDHLQWNALSACGESPAWK